MLATAYFFGTFNPIHWGHLAMAHQALQQFGLQRVVFIPSPQPPHRLHDADMAPAPDRLAMARLATAPFSGFSVNPLEFDRDGPSYTVDTLAQLHPTSCLPIPLIMGYDAALSLPTWHRANELLQRCTVLVAPRHPAITGHRAINKRRPATLAPCPPSPLFNATAQCPVSVVATATSPARTFRCVLYTACCGPLYWLEWLVCYLKRLV
jgi:nicotinate (nicotinamide) nucleotide adenylyltransferase